MTKHNCRSLAFVWSHWKLQEVYEFSAVSFFFSFVPSLPLLWHLAIRCAHPIDCLFDYTIKVDLFYLSLLMKA